MMEYDRSKTKMINRIALTKFTVHCEFSCRREILKDLYTECGTNGCKYDAFDVRCFGENVENPTESQTTRFSTE